VVWLWRHRWPLAPFAVGAGAVAGVVCAPEAAGLGLTAAGVLAEAAAWAGPRVTWRGRMGLSVRERRTAAVGLAAAAGWVTVVDAVPLLSVRWDAALLAATLGAPAVKWWRARVKPAAKLSPAAAALVDKWAAVAGPTGPRALRGSVPMPGSVTEPVQGAVSMIVKLAGVHAADATAAKLGRDVEVALGLPADTVRLTAVRDDGPADRLQVTMTPTRHLEEAPTSWLGPVLNADGSMPVAVGPDGAVIEIHLFNEDGVEHGLISGTSGMGKGGSTVVVCLPGILPGSPAGGGVCQRVVFYADGKRGMSAPELHPIATRLAVNEQQWAQAVDIVHAVMCAREDRYGKAGIKRFQAGINPDPTVTLLLDEATTLAGALSAKRARKVAEIAQRGRATGIQLIQVSQSVRSDMIVGGVPTRDLLTGAGFSIAHKPGGASAARLATDGIPVPGLVQALQSLPAQPGFAVISRRGQVLAAQARVFDAEAEAIARLADWTAAGGRPLELTGADLAAAGPAYTRWDNPRPDDAGAGDTPDGRPTPAGDPAGQGQGGGDDPVGEWVLDVLDEDGPHTAKALDDRPDNPVSRATLYRTLNRLQADGEITNTRGTWHLTGTPATDDEVAADDETTHDLEHR
jgi:hypothetical protein